MLDTLYTPLVHAHSGIRYLVLLLVVITALKAFVGWFGKQSYSGLDNKLSLISLIVTHIQFLLGLILYVISPRVIFSGASMGNATARYWLVEHISLMIIAVVLITLGRSLSKRATDDAGKHKRVAIFFGIAITLVSVGLMTLPG